jgi:hypothetical protein
MIRNNLATRPFYNEQAVRLWLGIGIFIIAAATMFNVSSLVYYARSDSELATRAGRDEARAAELRAAAVQSRASVDAKQVELASLEARQANELIDRRTFSWTELFNRFATTLPADVRITSVQPRVEEDHRIILRVGVLARDVQDVDELMENLDQTGAFTDLLSREEQINDEGQLEAVLETVYVPGAPEAPAPGGSESSGTATAGAEPAVETQP